MTWTEEREKSAVNKTVPRLDATVCHVPCMEDVVPPREESYLFFL